MRVGHDEDLRACMEIMDQVAGTLWKETHADDATGDIIEDPKVLGVQAINDSSVTLRMVVKTDPSAQWKVQRELRLRLIEAFDAAGVSIPIPTLLIDDAAGVRDN